MPSLSEPIVWQELKKNFILWAKGRFGNRYVKDMVNSLNKFGPVIKAVEDIDKLFTGDFPGKRHLWFGVRNLLKFCASHGWDRATIDSLMEVMPPVKKSGVDKRVPREHEVVELLNRLVDLPAKYQAFYNLVLDSAIRPLHGIEILNCWDEGKLEKVNDRIYKYYADIERRQKHTFIVLLTDATLKLINETIDEPATEVGYVSLVRDHKLLRPKYLQKFAYNMMRKNGVDRDVADFLNGRKPQGVGAKHYAELIFLAEEQYPRYAEYITELRQKALN